jgi:hypothetical protein
VEEEGTLGFGFFGDNFSSSLYTTIHATLGRCCGWEPNNHFFFVSDSSKQIWIADLKIIKDFSQFLTI